MKIILRNPQPIAWLLSVLFPPRLPGKIEDWVSPDTNHLPLWLQNRVYTPTPNTARPARPKRFQWRPDAAYFHQMHNAHLAMVEYDRELAAQGYTNTIHDCWEKIEEAQ